MQYIVMEIGCLECGNDSTLVGVYKNLEDARKDYPEAQVAGVDYSAEYGEIQQVIFPLAPQKEQL